MKSIVGEEEEQIEEALNKEPDEEDVLKDEEYYRRLRS